MNLEIKGNGKSKIERMVFSVQTQSLTVQCGAAYLNSLSLGIYSGKPPPKILQQNGPWADIKKDSGYDYGGHGTCNHTLREVYDLLDTIDWIAQFDGAKSFYLMTDEVACWRNNADRSCVNLDAVRKKTAFTMADFVNYLIYKKIGVVARSITTNSNSHPGDSVIVAWTWVPVSQNILSDDIECYNAPSSKVHVPSKTKHMPKVASLLPKAQLFLKQQKAAANGYGSPSTN